MMQSKIKAYTGTPFSVECIPVVNKPGTWNSTKVSIFRGEDLIGEYVRNYSSMATDTFYPFQVGTEWYAMYSASYTATRVMKLHEDRIEDWCGEAPTAHGFCPTEFYVPKYNTSRLSYEHNGEKSEYDSYTVDCDMEAQDFLNEQKVPDFVSVQYCKFGFLSGCVWGDDTSWKLRYIDLSQIPDKVLTITEKFGYWELPDAPLKKNIRMDGWEPDHHWITLVKQEYFNLEKDVQS